MKRFLSPTCIALTATISMMSGTLVAQEEADEGRSIFPVEMYTCNYNDGKGPGELDQWVARWNAFVDDDPEAYSAWTLTPFYFGEDQDFDFIWLGTSPDATTFGRAYDKYLRNPELGAAFREFANCSSHSNFATLNIKPPPEDGAPSFVLSFSDCDIADGKSYDDVAPALKAWSEYRSEHGSPVGMWVLWPAYGGGNADFDFKFVTSYRSHESLGVDYDQYGKEGYKKAGELFTGLLDCNDARSYIAQQRREGTSGKN